MSWVRIWVHLVFTTKDREPFLKKEIRQKVFQHIKENAIQKEIILDLVNGYSEHVHCLISLHKDQSISQVIKLLKGESSHWINQHKLIPYKFSWQDDYWAVSVSESHVAKLKEYITKQEEHHRKKSFEEEIEFFLSKYGNSVIKK